MTFLGAAYLRRIQLESRIHAAAYIKALNESMVGSGERRIPPEAMVAMMGGL
jgi:hypothetical protein